MAKYYLLKQGSFVRGTSNRFLNNLHLTYIVHVDKILYYNDDGKENAINLSIDKGKTVYFSDGWYAYSSFEFPDDDSALLYFELEVRGN